MLLTATQLPYQFNKTSTKKLYWLGTGNGGKECVKGFEVFWDPTV
jgi:hypothetical protein